MEKSETELLKSVLLISCVLDLKRSGQARLAYVRRAQSHPHHVKVSPRGHCVMYVPAGGLSVKGWDGWMWIGECGWFENVIVTICVYTETDTDSVLSVSNIEICLSTAKVTSKNSNI